MSKRIIIISQYFFPEERTAPRNLYKLASYLTEMGNDVTVLTSIPNHPYGKIYRGYKKIKFYYERCNGFSVIRSPLYPYHGNSSLKRGLNYISFALSASFAIIRYSVLRKKFDVVFSYLPPLTIKFPIYLLGKFQNNLINEYYWLTDLWPENILSVKTSAYGIIIKLIRTLEKFTFSNLSHIFLNSPGFIPRIESVGVCRKDISVIYDWPDEELLNALSTKSEMPKEYNNCFSVVYAGNHGTPQGLKFVIKTAKLLSKFSDIRIFFIGEGSEKNNLIDYSLSCELNNVYFLPQMRLRDLSKYLAHADILLVSLIDSPVYKMQIPSKLITYLACGKPIIASVPGISSKLVSDHNAGLYSFPGDEVKLKTNILKMYNLPISERMAIGNNAHSLYNKMFTPIKQMETINRVLND